MAAVSPAAPAASRDRCPLRWCPCLCNGVPFDRSYPIAIYRNRSSTKVKELVRRVSAQRKRSCWPMPSRARLRRASRGRARCRGCRPRCQNRIVSSSRSRPGLQPATIWPSSACSVSSRELAGLDVGAQRAERPRRALAPVVDHQLVHDVGQRQLDRAHRAVGHDQRAGLDPLGAQQRLRALEPRGLDHDVGAAHARLPVVGDDAPARRDRAAAARRSARGSRGGANGRGSRRTSKSRSSRRTFQ